MFRGIKNRTARVAPEEQAAIARLSAVRVSSGESAMETTMDKPYWRLLQAAIAELSSGRLMEVLGFAESIVATDYVMGDVPLEHLPAREWPIRSYEHAWGFAARMFYGIDPLDVYALIRRSPLSSCDYWYLTANGIETLERPTDM